MGQPAARIGDMQTCPLVETDGIRPYTHLGGVLQSAGMVTTVFINGSLAAVKGDISKCADTLAQPFATVNQGSSLVNIQGKPAARVGDSTDHAGGTITQGSPNVNIGG